jgi:hypothetical protein
MALTRSEAEVIEAARDIVALWRNPRIRALPRSERNAAIEDARTRLIVAVGELDAGVAQR